MPESSIANAREVRVLRGVAALALGVSLSLAGCSPVASPPSTDTYDEQQVDTNEPEDEAPQDEPQVEPAEPAAPAAPAKPAGGDAVDPSTIFGVWAASDGSGLKIIDPSGACSGMYYNNGTPLDIGGPMSCALGSQQRSDGSYLLVVTQSPNQSSYAVSFAGENTFALTSGGVVITMTRQ